MSDLISRDAAIVALAHNRYGNDEWDLAVTHDVETIKKLPSVELESKLEKCEDCISRKAATDRFDLVQSDDKCMGYDDILAFLSSLPSVEPKRTPGKWHLLDECANEGWYCDQCHKKVFRADFSNTMKKYKFCPNCGAKMEELK